MPCAIYNIIIILRARFFTPPVLSRAAYIFTPSRRRTNVCTTTCGARDSVGGRNVYRTRNLIIRVTCTCTRRKARERSACLPCRSPAAGGGFFAVAVTAARRRVRDDSDLTARSSRCFWKTLKRWKIEREREREEGRDRLCVRPKPKSYAVHRVAYSCICRRDV